MTIRKRGNRWAVEIYDGTLPTRKRYVGTYNTEREARRAERDATLMVEQRQGQATQTISEFAHRWLELFPRRKESTNHTYREQIKPYVQQHGTRRLADITVQDAVTWVNENPWTHGGVRAMFSDARRAGLVTTNPFIGLRVKGTGGRKNLVPLTAGEIQALAQCAYSVWDGEVAQMVYALVLTAGFVGMRPGELYGLRWTDIDWQADEIHVQRQYVAKTREFTTPKNNRARRIVLTAPARQALEQLPRTLGDGLVFRATRGGPMTGKVQHYYWQPVRIAYGRPSMEFYELRHACASWLFNELGLPAQDVAHQLGHTDGGALIQRLYGHPSEGLARERIKRAMGGNIQPLRGVTEAERRQAL